MAKNEVKMAMATTVDHPAWVCIIIIVLFIIFSQLEIYFKKFWTNKKAELPPYDFNEVILGSSASLNQAP